MKQIIFVLILVALISCKDDLTCDLPSSKKVDCASYGIKEDGCLELGCCWIESSPNPFEKVIFERMLLSEDNEMISEINEKYPSNDTPWCFYQGKPSNACKAFNFDSKTAGFEGTYAKLEENYMKNINIDNLGGVVASPDPDTPGGSYIYHWMRDAGLTMRAFMKINDYKLSAVQENMDKYLGWVLRVQNEVDPNDISVLIEPKFDLPNGEPYEGGWCRPQTDGPGLRSGALMQYANILLDAGQTVSEDLWNANQDGAIQKDLDWIVTGWKDEGCDLWEEVRSTDFFWNRMSFYQSLTWGAQLATKLGDSELAQTYQSTADTIKPTVLAHWNGEYVYESLNRKKDSAVIHAFVELNEGLFDITGKEVAGTIEALNKLFCNEYDINQIDDGEGVPGVLYGRYGGDSYAGGNPWQLLTAALAEAFYQGAVSMLKRNDQVLSTAEVNPWRNILKLGKNPTARDFAKAANNAGNAVMYRMWTHVEKNVYELTEQMDKVTGTQLSAKSLTWSFSNVLKNLHSYVNNEELASLNSEN